MNVKFISMNYENSCVYLCFCCVDAVDCGRHCRVTWGGLDGCLWIDMDCVLFCLVVTPPCGYWIQSSMTAATSVRFPLSRE